ncbi:hypothetical protein AB0H76_04420 [Nocardia sp. NPDC050712]|uniref:hypothetical protein n=1 Tax=Nocardia sp. NPDC050712 TaxID=3155518 RepID=UPI0033FF8556
MAVIHRPKHRAGVEFGAALAPIQTDLLAGFGVFLRYFATSLTSVSTMLIGFTLTLYAWPAR